MNVKEWNGKTTNERTKKKIQNAILKIELIAYFNNNNYLAWVSVVRNTTRTQFVCVMSH